MVRIMLESMRATPRPADPGREHGRRRRHHRRQPGRARGARRLHDQRRHLGHPRRQRLRLFDALRPREGFRDGGAAAERAALVHRAEKSAAEGLQGVHRLSQGKQRQGHRRLGRRRRQLGGLRLLFRQGHRHQHDAGALSRRRAGLAGHRRRQRRHDVRSRGQFARAGEGRHHQGLCGGDIEEAMVRGAGRADRRRGRRARSRSQQLARRLRAQGHAEGHRRQAEQRVRGRDGRSGGPPADCGSGPWKSRRPSSRPRKGSRCI